MPTEILYLSRKDGLGCPNKIEWFCSWIYTLFLELQSDFLGSSDFRSHLSPKSQKSRLELSECRVTYQEPNCNLSQILQFLATWILFIYTADRGGTTHALGGPGHYPPKYLNLPLNFILFMTNSLKLIFYPPRKWFFSPPHLNFWFWPWPWIINV